MSARLILPLLLAGACLPALVLAAPAPALHENEVIKLPCGHTIKVLSVSRVDSSRGVAAVMVRYQTTLSLEQRKALSEEVDDVFKVVVREVDRQGYSEAILSSNEVPKGVFLTASRMLNFIYEKGSDGKWTRLNRADFMAAE